MEAKKPNADTSDKECCKNKETTKNLVKATELPIHGNPYPPKDCILNETPSQIELKVASMRNILQPISGPLAGAVEKVSDIAAIGVAHSQSGLQRIFGEDSSVREPAIVVSSALFGATILGRRKGIPKKIFYGTLFSFGAYTYLYPQDMKNRAFKVATESAIGNSWKKFTHFFAKDGGSKPEPVLDQDSKAETAKEDLK